MEVRRLPFVPSSCIMPVGFVSTLLRGCLYEKWKKFFHEVKREASENEERTLTKSGGKICGILRVREPLDREA